MPTYSPNVQERKITRPCPNNDIDCPCTKEGCPRHGKCCECVAHHKAHGTKLPACLRGDRMGEIK